jgi:hypothetical protein
VQRGKMPSLCPAFNLELRQELFQKTCHFTPSISLHWKERDETPASIRARLYLLGIGMTPNPVTVKCFGWTNLAANNLE